MALKLPNTLTCSTHMLILCVFVPSVTAYEFTANGTCKSLLSSRWRPTMARHQGSTTLAILLHVGVAAAAREAQTTRRPAGDAVSFSDTINGLCPRPYRVSARHAPSTRTPSRSPGDCQTRRCDKCRLASSPASAESPPGPDLLSPTHALHVPARHRWGKKRKDGN